MPDTKFRPVRATEPALRLIGLLQAEYGNILFRFSGDCPRDTVPICVHASSYRAGKQEVRLGEIGGAAVFVGEKQLKTWKEIPLVIDLTTGEGEIRSLASGTGKRFTAISEFTLKADIL